MSEKRQKTEFNMKQFLESDEYSIKKALLNAEINSNEVSTPKIERSTKQAIKDAKKAYNKLKKDPEVFKITRDELLTSLVQSANKEYKSNFKLIV